MNPQPKFPKPVSRPKKTRKPMRRSRMRKKAPRRLKRAGANPGYVAWLHSLACVIDGQFSPVGERHRCEGRIEQSHARDMTGIGRKEPDLRSVPKCSRAHREWEQRIGFFAHWGKDLRRGWMAARVATANAAWFALTPEQRAEWDATALRKDR